MTPVHPLRHASAPASRPARLALGLVLLAALAAAAPASAQIGLRGGVSGEPSQFFVGVHYETDPFADRLRFRPNAEAGFGDNLTLVALNFEFIWDFPIRRQPWAVYVGAGPAVNIYRWDRGNRSDSNTEPGLNFLFGLGHRDGFFGELKIGAIDSPEVKFAVGYTFK
jgi:hypothetical protein